MEQGVADARKNQLPDRRGVLLERLDITGEESSEDLAVAETVVITSESEAEEEGQAGVDLQPAGVLAAPQEGSACLCDP